MPTLRAKVMFNYPSGTRKRFKPGDEFSVSRQSEADTLVAIGFATKIDGPAKAAAPKVASAPTIEQRPKGLIALREEYYEMTGGWPDMRYGAARLTEEISRLKYQRRDMRAED